MLTPMEIHSKEFRTRMRGYDKDEVDAFMHKLEKDIEELIKNKSQLVNELNLVKTRLHSFEETEEIFNESVLATQESAEKIKWNAQREADVLLEEAQDNADRLLHDAVNKAKSIDKETEDLSKQSHVLRQKLQSMLESHLELLMNQEWGTVLDTEEVSTTNSETIHTLIEGYETSEASAPIESKEKH